MRDLIYKAFSDELQKIARGFLETHEAYAQRKAGRSSDPQFDAWRSRPRARVFETDKGPILLKGKSPQSTVAKKIQGKMSTMVRK